MLSYDNMAEKHMLDTSSGAEYEGADTEQKRIKLEEQGLVQAPAPQGGQVGTGGGKL